MLFPKKARKGRSGQKSETGRIRFRGVRFQTPNSVSFFGLTEFRGENSVSFSEPIICVPKRTHRVPQNSVSSLFRNSTLETVFRPFPIIRAEKDTQTQRFHQKIPCLNPPFLGAFKPRNSLCSGCVFSLKCRKNANTRNFEGRGEGGKKKALC